MEATTYVFARKLRVEEREMGEKPEDLDLAGPGWAMLERTKSVIWYRMYVARERVGNEVLEW